MSKPLLLIDVDGVLNPVGRHKPEKGWQRLHLGDWWVNLNPMHGEWLNSLADAFELTWATTWEDEANQYIGPVIGLPELPVIRFSEEDFTPETPQPDQRYETWKLPSVKAYVGDRPFAWLDDDLHKDAFDWAIARTSNGRLTNLYKVDPHMGLLPHHIDKLRFFASASEAIERSAMRSIPLSPWR
jgi:hypothetical protein